MMQIIGVTRTGGYISLHFSSADRTGLRLDKEVIRDICVAILTPPELPVGGILSKMHIFTNVSGIWYSNDVGSDTLVSLVRTTRMLDERGMVLISAYTATGATKILLKLSLTEVEATFLLTILEGVDGYYVYTEKG